MGDVIITVLGLWVFIKILKVIFGSWSKSDYQRDRYDSTNRKQPMTVVPAWHSEGRKSQYLILPLVEKYQPKQRAGSKRVSSASPINNRMF